MGGQPMLKILGRSSSINVQKVMWCAAELGAEVERIDIGGKYGGNDTPEYLGLNPNGLVPTMEDGEVVLWESNTIVRYLAETRGSPPWFATDAAGRGLASQWMDWYLTRLHPPMTVIFMGQVRTAPEDRDREARRAQPTADPRPARGCAAGHPPADAAERVGRADAHREAHRVEDRAGL